VESGGEALEAGGAKGWREEGVGLLLLSCPGDNEEASFTTINISIYDLFYRKTVIMVLCSTDGERDRQTDRYRYR